MPASLSWQRSAEARGAMPDLSAPDEQLIRSFRAGNEEAFDRLFLRYQDYVYNICLGILSNPDDARDAAQEAFLRVHRNLERFNGRSALTTWIYRIAVNECLGRVRKRRPQPPVPLEDPQAARLRDPGPQPGDGLARAAQDQVVRQIVAGLKPDYRAALVLRYFQEMSYEEMRAVLRWSLPQVKVKLHRARKAFARAYAEAAEAEQPPQEETLR